jgi:hypothetical protein
VSHGIAPDFVFEVHRALTKLGVTGHVMHWRQPDGFRPHALGVAIELPDANKPPEFWYRDGRLIPLLQLRDARVDLAAATAQRFADNIVATGGVHPLHQ